MANYEQQQGGFYPQAYPTQQAPSPPSAGIYGNGAYPDPVKKDPANGSAPMPPAHSAPPLHQQPQYYQQPYQQAQAAPASSRDSSSTHLLVSWLLFGIGFLFPLTWLVAIFIPCCRRPRFTKGTFAAWLLSLIFLAIYAAILAVVIVFVVRNKDDICTYNSFYGTYYC